MSFIVGSPSNCRILLNSEPGHLINVNCMIMDSYINLNYGHFYFDIFFLLLVCVSLAAVDSQGNSYREPRNISSLAVIGSQEI